jgi:hypothetical protein
MISQIELESPIKNSAWEAPGEVVGVAGRRAKLARWVSTFRFGVEDLGCQGWCFVFCVLCSGLRVEG